MEVIQVGGGYGFDGKVHSDSLFTDEEKAENPYLVAAIAKIGMVDQDDPNARKKVFGAAKTIANDAKQAQEIRASQAEEAEAKIKADAKVEAERQARAEFDTLVEKAKQDVIFGLEGGEVSTEVRKQVALMKAEFLEAAVAEDRSMISLSHANLLMRSMQASVLGILIAIVGFIPVTILGLPLSMLFIPMLVILVIKMRPGLKHFEETLEKIKDPSSSPDPKVVDYIRKSFWKSWWSKYD